MNEFRDWIVRFGAKAGEYDVPIKPIVYCKECKHNYYNTSTELNPNGDVVCQLFETEGIMHENDFCSKGEEKQKLGIFADMDRQIDAFFKGVMK